LISGRVRSDIDARSPLPIADLPEVDRIGRGDLTALF